MWYVQKFAFIEVTGCRRFYKLAYMRLTREDSVRAHVWLSGISQNPNLPSPTLPLPSSCPSFCLSRGLHE